MGYEEGKNAYMMFLLTLASHLPLSHSHSLLQAWPPNLASLGWIFFIVLAGTCLFSSKSYFVTSPFSDSFVHHVPLVVSVPSAPETEFQAEHARLSLSTEIPPLPTEQEQAGSFVAFHVLTTRASAFRFLHAQSREWLAELNSVGRLFLSVGQSESDDDVRVVEDIRRLFPLVTVIETASSDSEYPPIVKTIQAFEYLSEYVAPAFPFVYNLDDDTTFMPLRLAAIMSQRDSTKPLYMGRPLFNCLCAPGELKNYNCTKSGLGVSYCSGAGYGFSRQTLLDMHGKWTHCWESHRSMYATCHSSDTFIGLCVNKEASTTCTAATVLGPESTALELTHEKGRIDPYMAAAYAASIPVPGRNPNDRSPKNGVSWAAVQEDGWALPVHALFCQDPTHNGGPKERGHFAQAHVYVKSDSELCAFFHPNKVAGVVSPAHARYLR